MNHRDRGSAKTTVAAFILGVSSVLAATIVSADTGEANTTYSYASDFGRMGLGARHSCAVVYDSRIFCWGEDGDLQLGNDGFRIDSATPVQVAGITDAVAVTAGNGHTCALRSGGGVKCWGAGSSGRLGNNSSSDQGTPVDVFGPLTGVSAIAAGSAHTCAVTSAGGLKCWGNNGRGQIGNGTTNQANIPQEIYAAGSGVVAVAAGDWSTCAVFAGGSLKCWGENASGQLGTGDTADSLSPTQVSGLTSGVAAVSIGGVVALNGGTTHACALMTNGAVKCWGENTAGQLGIGNNIDQLLPSDVTLPLPAVGLATGAMHTCALLNNGALYCWGENSGQQVGDGYASPRNVPTAVLTMSSEVRSVAAGDEHTCAYKSDGNVTCWGSNANLQLGDGTNIDIPSSRKPGLPTTSTQAPATTQPNGNGSTSSTSTSTSLASTTTTTTSTIVSSTTTSTAVATTTTSTTVPPSTSTTTPDSTSPSISTTVAMRATEVPETSDAVVGFDVDTVTVACQGTSCTATTQLPTVGRDVDRLALFSWLSMSLGSLVFIVRRRLW